MGKELFDWDGKPVRLTTAWGDVFEGEADVCASGCGLVMPEREEASVKLGIYHIFESQIRSIEALDPERLCDFYGAEFVPEAVRELYRDLCHVWCAETCTPRMRGRWSPENATLGQCAVTAFLVQDLFGGIVYGIPLPDGGFHCYNEVDGHVFDLTSGQFEDEDLDYFGNPEQRRETHFVRTEKLERYELLKRLLREYREGKA